MDEFNEKDQIGESAGTQDMAREETSADAALPMEAPEQEAPPSAVEETLSAVAEEAPSREFAAPPMAAEPPSEEPAAPDMTARWSSRGGQNSPPPYQRPYPPYQQQGQQGGGAYPPPYYGAGAPNGGYGYGRQAPPYGQNGGYPPQGGYEQQYGTNSGWQQKPPPAPEEPYEWKFEDYDKLDGKKREKKKRNRGVVVFTVVLVCFLCAGMLGLSAYSVYTAMASVTEEETASPETAEASPRAEAFPDSTMEITAQPSYSETLPVGGKMTIPQVAETVLPSVAGVIIYNQDQEVQPETEGSGIIMNMDGYIITNAHVVLNAARVKVQLHSGETLDAVLVGMDELSDLAVLKIEAEGLVPAQFGYSETLRVGETVIAVGNPGGVELAGSVTLGIVSAVDRIMANEYYSATYIQTDAAINPGNSGGALVNEYGQVIGINTAKIVAAGYEGIGFAIPVSVAKPIIDELIASGHVVSRVSLGISGEPTNAMGSSTYYGERGVRITQFNGDTELSRSAQVDDIITHLDGERVYTIADIRSALSDNKIGDTVRVTLYRRIINQDTNFEVDTRLIGSGEARDNP